MIASERLLCKCFKVKNSCALMGGFEFLVSELGVHTLPDTGSLDGE